MSQIDMSQYKKDARGNLVPIDNIAKSTSYATSW